MAKLDTNYKKRHLAMVMLETEGWTKEITTDVASHVIFSDKELDMHTLEQLRAVYPLAV